MSFPKKGPDEIKSVTFDYTKEIDAGVVISDPVIEAEVVENAENVDDLDIGAPIILGPLVNVLIGGGIDGAIYRIKCHVLTDKGEHLDIYKDLPVTVTGPLVK